MILTGVIFGLGLSELMLILVVIVLMLGPNRISTIKPFLKVAYKNYLKYMQEVNTMQGEMESMKKTIMEPIEEVEKEALEELRSTEKEMYKGVKGAEDVKKGLKALVERSKKEMAQARAQAKLEKEQAGKQLPGQQGPRPRTQGKQQMNAAHIARGGHVGLLGKQYPGSSRRAPFGQKKGQGEVSLASALKPGDKEKLYGRTPGRAQLGPGTSRRQMPNRRQLGRQSPPQQKKPFWFQQQPAERKTPQVAPKEKPAEPVTVEAPVRVEEKPKAEPKPKKKPKAKKAAKKTKKSKKKGKPKKKKSKKKKKKGG